MKPQCLNDKTYPDHLSGMGTGKSTTHPSANFAFIWSFDIYLTLGFWNLTFYVKSKKLSSPF
ncbi:MAG: hypothetical protein DRG82_03410 [Deltaproteobacteria bacterium]|nr:MAG: hypothetical protein DRG82_03410 [Deltaproteobacteria bacterium]